MILLQRRIFLELMGNALTAALLLLFVLMLVASVAVLGLGAGLGIGEFLKLVPAFMAAALDLVLPIAVLVAVVLTYGRAAADNEVDTLRACGVHPMHLITPGLVFGALMSLLLLVVADYGKPWAERAKQQAIKDVDYAGLVARKLASGEPVNIDQNTVVSADDIDQHGNATNLRLQISDDEGRPTQVIVARESRIYVDEERSLIVLDLLDFHTALGQPGSGSIKITRPLANIEGELNMRALTTPQLMAWLARNEQYGRKLGTYRPAEIASELHFRLSTSVACLVFVLLGIPVALRQRRHDRLGAFLVAFLLSLFLYYPSLKVAKALAENRTLDASVAAWTGHAVILSVAAWYARRVSRG